MPMLDEEGAEQELQLMETLRNGRPTWSTKELNAARMKLRQVGIRDVAELFHALSTEDHLNSLLKNAGFKAFSEETRNSLAVECGRFLARQEESLRGNNARAKSAHLRQADKNLTQNGHEVSSSDEVDNKHQRPKEEIMNREAAAVRWAAPGQSEEGIPDLDDLLKDLNRQESLERDEAKSRGIQIDNLANLEDLPDLLHQLKRVETMTASKLRDLALERQFAVHEDMPRRELMGLVRDVVLWGLYHEVAIRETCGKRNILISSDQTRSECMQMLANKTWEDMGIPVTRFPDVDSAQRVLNSFIDLDNCSLSTLASKARKYNLDTGDQSREELVSAMKQISIWAHFSREGLIEDCYWRQLAVDADEEDSVMIMLKELVASLAQDRFDLWQIPVKDMDVGTAEIVLRQIERLHILGTLGLQAECRKQRIPFSDLNSDRKALIARLRNVIIWKQLSVPEFTRMCAQTCNLNLMKGSVRPSTPSSPIRLESILMMIRRQQELKDWEAQGIPISRLQSVEQGEAVAKEFAAIDVMPTDELIDWYRQTGFPEEKFEREELVRLAKAVNVWSALSVEELRKECEKAQIPTEVDTSSGDSQQQHSELVDRLCMNDRMNHWNARGFQAHRIGDDDCVRGMVVQFEVFQGLSEEELQRTFKEASLPLAPGMDKEDFLKALKTVMVWENLPLAEVEKECREKMDGNLPMRMDSCTGDDQRRSMMVRHLLFGLFKPRYEKVGVPVDQLGISVAMDVYAEFIAFEDDSDEALRTSLQGMALQLPPDTPRSELIEWMRRMMLWSLLPTPELFNECKARGIATHGFGMEIDEEELRDLLIVRLMLRSLHCKRASDLNELATRRLSVGLEAADDGENGSGVPFPKDGHIDPFDWKEVWSLIENMLDPLIIERVCNMPRKALPRDVYLPAEARSWEPIEAALYVLSGGVFHPISAGRNLRPSPPSTEKNPLLSVICPTMESRQQFHPLLYECFKAQTHEPKELVVVDSGNRRSAYFEQVVQRDPRVIYQFFPVSDSNADAPRMPRSRQWSLGLKRNIACYLARGVAIAHFDDDDLYAPEYLEWMWSNILKQAELLGKECDESLAPMAIKLTDWHLLDISAMNFSYLDVEADKDIPPRDRRGWLYGWGFSYFFTRTAWSLAPFPDIEFAEDAGFVEGLMAQSIPVQLIRLPPVEGSAQNSFAGLVAHTQHTSSTSGGEVVESGEQRGKRVGTAVHMPAAFNGLMLAVKSAHKGWSSALFQVTKVATPVTVKAPVVKGSMKPITQRPIEAPRKEEIDTGAVPQPYPDSPPQGAPLPQSYWERQEALKAKNVAAYGEKQSERQESYEFAPQPRENGSQKETGEKRNRKKFGDFVKSNVKSNAATFEHERVGLKPWQPPRSSGKDADAISTT